MKKGAVKYLVMLLVQRLLGLLLFVAGAGTIMDLRGMVNFSLYFAISIAACVVMYLGHQETLHERGQKHDNTKSWDKLLLPIYVFLAYYGIYLVAGLGVRLQWPRLPVGWMYAGVALYLVSGLFTVWPVMENKHFETTSRIQDDRAQTVISTGPYRIVRHPGYMGVVLWAAATAMMFGTLAVGIVAALIIAVIVVRTYLEDTMLKEELDGYRAYADKVRHRLIPFIW